MASRQLGTVLQYIRRLAGMRATELTDGGLLERFIFCKDEAAFEALLERHGPMVLAVCRRVLHNPADIDDAFQATFLVLVAKADSIAKRQSVSSWLHGVAYRTACRARARAARCRAREQPLQEVSDPLQEQPGTQAAYRELRYMLDEELGRLPEKYRVPLILCYLEGKTNAEAAHQLGWPLGTVQVRLLRAREMLRTRLTRRGVALPSILAGPLLPIAGQATVPSELTAATLRLAILFAGNYPAASMISAQVSTLVKGILHTMFLTKLTIATTVIVVVSMVGVAAGVLGQHVLANKEYTTEKDDTPNRAAPMMARPEPSDNQPFPKDSNAWHVLRQSNTLGLLHGMPQRLAQVIIPSRRTGPRWDGIDAGGSLQLDIAVEDGIKGEIFVGFFTDPGWSADPVQARSFPGPGRYTLDKLIPGTFQLAAMVGLPPQPRALGVHREWPTPVEITAGETKSKPSSSSLLDSRTTLQAKARLP